MVGDFLDGFAQTLEAFAELSAQGCLFMPTQGLAWIDFTAPPDGC